MPAFLTAIFCALLAAAPAAAQQSAGKAIVLVREMDGGMRLVSAVDQAQQLKKAGLDVRLVFEGEGVLNFLLRRRTDPEGPQPELAIEEGGVVLSSAAQSERIQKYELDFALIDAADPADPAKQAEKATDRRLKDKPDRNQRMFHRRPDPRRVTGSVPYTRAWSGPAGDDPYQFGGTDALYAAVKEVPYTICSFSAELFGVYAELKAAGRTLSPDPSQPVDLSGYIKDGYAIYVY